MEKLLIFSVLSLCFTGILSEDLPVTQQCLGCLCEASSNCDISGQCAGDVCGPFRITWAYWADGGKPTINKESPDGPQAYGRCASDTYCSALAVQGYMQKFQQDCNGDKRIDCDDFALIHKYGGYGCVGQTLPGVFGQRYLQCKTLVGGAPPHQ